MKCSICGAELKKEGDICTNCYKNMQLQEELDKDNKIMFQIGRKYSIAYEMTKYTWVFIILILSAIVCFLAKNILAGFLCILFLVATIGFLLFWDKRVALATKATFYETKTMYTFKFFLMDIDKTVKYTDIKDVKCYQTFTQKKFGYGDLCIYAKGAFPGATLLNGYQIKNVENVENVVNTIIKIVGDATIEL